jgi:signal transduction histidine kinase
VTAQQAILANRRQILDRWASRARQLTPEARRLPRRELEDNLPGILDELARALARGETSGQRSPNAVEHGKQRFRVGFDLEAVVREYAILREVIFELFDVSGVPVTFDEITTVSEVISGGITNAVVEYSRARTHILEIMVGVLSHDLRDPLHAITLGADSLLKVETASIGVVAAVARRMRRSAARMKRHVEYLLDVTRAGFAGGFPIKRRWTDAAQVAGAIVDEYAAANPDRRIILECDGIYTGSWDADRLAQVTANLISNALRHGSLNDPITVRINGDEEQSVLEVHNFGDPIGEQRLPRIFEAFEPRPEGESDGLGLGLYIAREIVRAHGGTIDVESDRDRGTTFRIQLPRRAS